MTIVIGGGIAGCYITLKLVERSESSEKIILYEQNELLSGNPYVHLHRFGILYPELTLEEENEFIEDGQLFLEEFGDCVIKKPTVVIYRRPYSPQDLVKKCQRISEKIDEKGETFYQIYEKDDINFEKKRLKKGDKCLKCCCSDMVSLHDQYVNEMLKHFNLDYLTFPFVSCFEYLIDQKKVREKILSRILGNSNIEIRYEKFNFSKLEEDCKEIGIEEGIYNQQIYDCTNNGPKKEHKGLFKFELTSLDLMKFPEIALIGKRGSEKPLIQITPINNQLYIHILNNKATLIEENLDNGWRLFNFFGKNSTREDFVKNEVSKILPIFEKATFQEFYHGYQSFVDEKRTSSILEIGNKENKIKKVILVKAFSISGLFKRNLEK